MSEKEKNIYFNNKNNDNKDEIYIRIDYWFASVNKNYIEITRKHVR